MNKIIITTLLLCTGLVAAGCEKTYSVAEFKKDKNLRDEWLRKCGWSGTSQNCKNLTDAAIELQKESIQELINEHRKKYRNNDDEQKAQEQSEKQQNNN